MVNVLGNGMENVLANMTGEMEDPKQHHQMKMLKR